MSKKYKEEIDKIVMNDDMKKRILQNVLAASENSEEKNLKVVTTVPKVKKYSNVKRNMQIVAASFTVVLCLSIAKNYPMLLKSAPNDLEQNESSESHDNENNDLKINDDNGVVYNKDSNETSNNDNKEEQAVNPNNNIHNNGDSSEKKESNTSSSSKTGKAETNKDKLQSSSSSEAKKSEPSQNNDGKAAGNSNISSKPNPVADANNKESRNATSLEAKTPPWDIKENKVPEDNTDNYATEKSVMSAEDVNYNQEYKTLDEAEKALNLKVNSLKTVPKGYEMGNVSTISNEIIQVDYNNGNSNITFRAGKGTDNISGDYNEYQVKKTVKVNGLNVNLEGNKSEEYNLAVWERDGISYSISAENGIDEKTILNMIL